MLDPYRLLSLSVRVFLSGSFCKQTTRYAEEMEIKIGKLSGS